MKNTKKILSIILAIMMIISIVPLTASAATYTGTCGDNLTWTYDDTTYTLTISGTGAMYDFNGYDTPWYTVAEKVQKIIINNGVTTIGRYAFSGVFVNLKCITIPNGITKIGMSAFLGCPNLDSITIPSSVTTIGEQAFEGCDLVNISVDEDNQYYSSDDFGVLFNKEKTELIRYPVRNERTDYTVPEGVTLIGFGAFWGASNLTGIIVPNSVIRIDTFALSFCSNLNEITIGDNVQIIGAQAFMGCYSLTNINIPDSVTTIGCEAFFRCTSLESVTIPDSVTTIGDSAFAYCYSLTSVTIGDSVTTIGSYAFCSCSSLTSVTIPDSVTTIGEWAFDSCDSLTDVYYSGTEKQWNAISIGSYNDPLLNATIHFHTHEYGEWTVVTEPTCTETGLKTRTCECGDVKSEEIPATGHDYESAVTAPTCTEKGFTTHTCVNCSDTYVDNCVDATGHKYNEVVTQPTCTQNGYTTYTCDCGDTYMKNMIPTTGHADNDKNGYCDICDELLCDHDCHRGGFAGFFWKIANFFNKIFGIKKYCDCGIAHY